MLLLLLMLARLFDLHSILLGASLGFFLHVNASGVTYLSLGGFFSKPGLWVKTLAYCFRLDGGGSMHRYTLGGGGVAAELKYHQVTARWRLRVCFGPSLMVFRLWHGMDSLVSYHLHMSM